jgi:hypothetical protein
VAAIASTGGAPGPAAPGAATRAGDAAAWAGGAATWAGDAAARRALRDQIARLERELATTLASTYPRIATPPAPAHGPSAPRLLDLARLERTRDALAARLSDVQRRAAEQARGQAAARARLQALLADPPGHKGERIANAELGLPGCTTYAVLPRLGPVGLLTNWWRVKISSGCPLPG